MTSSSLWITIVTVDLVLGPYVRSFLLTKVLFARAVSCAIRANPLTELCVSNTFFRFVAVCAAFLLTFIIVGHGAKIVRLLEDQFLIKAREITVGGIHRVFSIFTVFV